MRGVHHKAILIGTALASVVLAAGMANAAASGSAALIPTPKMIIYPGDTINDDMLEDIALEEAGSSTFSVLRARASIVGKVASRTLLPGQGIPVGGVSAPKLIANGADVKIVYIEDGLSIMAKGMALQDGWLGDQIRVRNSDSGVIVAGKVNKDGTVRVDGD